MKGMRLHRAEEARPGFTTHGGKPGPVRARPGFADYEAKLAAREAVLASRGAGVIPMTPKDHAERTDRLMARFAAQAKLAGRDTPTRLRLAELGAPAVYPAPKLELARRFEAALDANPGATPHKLKAVPAREVTAEQLAACLEKVTNGGLQPLAARWLAEQVLAQLGPLLTGKVA